jgi:hypothetical protein
MTAPDEATMHVLDALCHGVEVRTLDDDNETITVRAVNEAYPQGVWVHVPDAAFEELVRPGWVEFYAEGEFEVSHTGKWHWSVWADRRAKAQAKLKRKQGVR